MKTDPITDAGLAELDRWLAIANKPYEARYKAAKRDAQAMVARLVPGVIARLETAELELQGWRHERAMTLTAFAHIRDGGDPALIGHPGGSVFGDALRDMLQKRLETAEREREEYQEATQGRLELVRQLDVLMNGEEGAAEQAALCDIVAQFPVWLAARDARMKREGGIEAYEWAAKRTASCQSSDEVEEWLQQAAKRLREEK